MGSILGTNYKTKIFLFSKIIVHFLFNEYLQINLCIKNHRYVNSLYHIFIKDPIYNMCVNKDVGGVFWEKKFCMLFFFCGRFLGGYISSKWK